MIQNVESFENQNRIVNEQKKSIYPFLVYENQNDLDRLEKILACLKQSETGRQLIADAEKHQTTIKLDSGMRAYGSYDEVSNNLKINAASDLHRQVGTMAHELRHAQQFQKGILMDAYLDTPKCYIQNQSVSLQKSSTLEWERPVRQVSSSFVNLTRLILK